MHDILDPSAERAGKPAWVDLSGSNIRKAPTLLKLFPRARFIHMVRDGRAVTAAILKKRDMTDDLEQAFGHWVMRVRRSDAALRQMPPDAVLTIYLDDLTAHDRDNQFQRLVDYLELDEPKPMRDYFDRTISPEKAHVGAWRERMAPADARWVDRRYRRLVRRLRREGIDWVPEPGPSRADEPARRRRGSASPSGSASLPEPIFVGGVGRSGTHVMGRLIDAGPRYHWIPTEVRFHAWRGGLPDLCAGQHLDGRSSSRRCGAAGTSAAPTAATASSGWRRAEQLEAALAEFESGVRGRARRRQPPARPPLLDPAAEAGGQAGVGGDHGAGDRVRAVPARAVSAAPGSSTWSATAARSSAGTLKKVDLTDDPMLALAKWEEMVSAAGAAMRSLPDGRALTSTSTTSPPTTGTAPSTGWSGSSRSRTPARCASTSSARSPPSAPTSAPGASGWRRRTRAGSTAATGGSCAGCAARAWTGRPAPR